MITVVTCTIRRKCIDNVFANYRRQRWKNKRMIIVLNNDKLNIKRYRKRARRYKKNEIRVYRLSQKYKLGKCLNYAVKRASKGLVAKFDDDDYYGPKFLREAARAIKGGKAGIVGKHTSYVYFKAKRALMLYRPGGEWSYTRSLKGGTLVFRRSVWKRVKFPEFKKSGTDAGWLGRCHRRNIRIYSLSKKHYVCVRGKSSKGHTQKKSMRRYMSQCKMVKRTKRFRRYVN
ncbi:glycosyltransferase [Paenibacillus sp. MWE-103]|uniref:Glycosyltransferase n=1 Tax=Paenibacillus artemisiicola TaxID=1172618 RepID=A0ABS3WIM5_9BACL|nr:glycosyltransferase [Paenibacillus artemisiicola]MBO7748173.1 glycosyltransferase [Paenibacillus artemisiicola]